LQQVAPGAALGSCAERAAATVVGVMKYLATGKPFNLNDQAIVEALNYSMGMFTIPLLCNWCLRA
jgi:hypothetical protein